MARHKNLITRKGGKGSKMSKNTKPVEAKAKIYNKSRGEHFKDIVIAMLVTGIIAFIAGAQFQAKQNDAVNAAVQAIAPTAHAEQSK